MSEFSDSASGSFSTGTDRGSSIVSNDDSRALTDLQAGPDQEDDALDTDKRSFQEAVFSTISLISKNRAVDTSLRLAALRVVVEFLQLFLVLFNPTWSWRIQQDFWAYKAISWLLFKMLFVTEGYSTYISGFYFLTAATLTSTATMVWIAVVLKGENAENAWLKRIVSGLQLLSLVFCGFWWIGMLDCIVYMFDCQWPNLASGAPVHHVGYPDQDCLAMPHLAHMLVAVVIMLVFCWNVLILALGSVDMNPLTRNILASSDTGRTVKILATKMVLVILCTSLDSLGKVQAVLVLLTTVYLMHLHNGGMFYAFYVNAAWTGLAWALVCVAGILTGLELTFEEHLSDPTYAEKFTMAVLYAVLPALLWGVFGAWCHDRIIRRTSSPLLAAYEIRRQAAAGNNWEDLDAPEKLKKCFRFRDVQQVSLFCRIMRKWDQDEAPDPEAVALGEFILKCGMARLPNDPALLILYANYLLEVKKDGQAARTQLQLAQKANPSLLQGYSIYAAQRLAKQLHKDGDALDLLSYVEYQQSYRTCVRSHKAVLLAQRQFWTCFMHDAVHYKDIQKRVSLMEAAELRATTTYKRVLERYPANGRLLKIYGRYLEYVRHDPWTASRFYAEAMKQGTSESLVSLARGQGGDGALSQAGAVNEKVDGVIVINALGSILMLNPAAVAMFGYDKGELEGKNVSLLMPAPFSTMHDGFLKRFVNGGEPHIIDRTRAMIALTKSRSMIPISLWVTRLSGVGAATLFIGVVRRVPSDASNEGRVIRFWTTPTGVMLCADDNASNTFGLEPSELVGQPFSDLYENSEEVARYIEEAAASDAGDCGELVEYRMAARLLHKYLPPVDVELQLQYGGATMKGSDCRTMVISVQVPSGIPAALAVDSKGRVTYATEKLAAMLKHPVTSLIKMDLNALLPQPYCQMHGAWFKDLSRTPGPTSCRAGGTVHLLAATSDKVPVTLKMSSRQHAEKGMLHVVQVSRVDETAAMNQHCLQLNINHQGIILETNAGVPKSLYGFTAAEVIGRPLAAIIDSFGLWRLKFGDDKSLLLHLAAQALHVVDDVTAGTCWRVGVHLPVQRDEDIIKHAEKLAAELQGKDAASAKAGGLLQALQQRNRLRPACMTVEMLQVDNLAVREQTAAGSMPIMKVSLHRADALSTVLELDKHLAIIHADDAAGLIFATHPRKLLSQSFVRLMSLPESTTFKDLLGRTGAAAKKGAMKGAAAGAAASKMGVARRVASKHPRDGKTLVLEMQAMSYQQAGRGHHLVRLQMVEPASASFEALLQLKEGRYLDDAGIEAAGATASAAAHEAEHSEHDEGAVSDGDNDGAASPRAAGSQDLEEQSRRTFNRVTTWVRESSRLPRTDDSPEDGREHATLHGCDEPGDEEAAVFVATRQRQQGGTECRDLQEASAAKQTADAAPGFSEYPQPMHRAAGRRVSCGAGSVLSSVADGASSAGDAASEGASGSAVGHEEDLAVDARRAKRLKKLNRLMQGNAVQMATRAWRSRTVMLLAVMLLAHVVCFAVVMLQVENRYSTVNGVANLVRALDGFMVMLLRANLIQKCWLPEWMGTMWACGPSQMQLYKARLQKDVAKAYTYHQLTYLNDGKGFEDKRLMDYWSHTQLPEYNFLQNYVLDNGTAAQDEVKASTNTLWVMGNNMASAGKDLYFMVSTRASDQQLRRNLNETTAWQYIYQNGVQSVFEGYAWSMDTYVEYCWQDLVSFASVAVVLLVIEVVVVHHSCLLYKLWLIQRCNMSHMKMFSIFLALPSATIRQMTQRPLQVDDDTTADPEEDDVDMADTGPAAEVEAGAASKMKSVRMEVAGVDEADEEDAPRPARSLMIGAAGHSSGKSKTKQKNRDKHQLTGFALLRKKTVKTLSSWIRPKFKVNGKRLMSNSSVVWRLTVPVIMWVAAAIIIFGVSVQELQGLDKPIAALDTSAHVLYNLARTRVAANLLAFSRSMEENAVNRAFLQQELTDFQAEYRSMLYGGPMQLKANVTFNPVAPASVFFDEAISDLFFRTTACLKADKSTCITDQADPFYNSVHSGLDVMVNRYMQEMWTFSKLPDNMAYANHSSYVWVLRVGAADLHDGLETAGELFVQHTINRLESVKQLHIILLSITLACLVLYLLFLYRPYLKLLHRDCKIVAGMLIQLPAEVDVEGHVKTVLLGWTKGAGSQSVIGASGSMGVAASGGSMLNVGAGFPPAAPRGSYVAYDTGSQAMRIPEQTGVTGAYPGYAVMALHGLRGSYSEFHNAEQPAYDNHRHVYGSNVGAGPAQRRLSNQPGAW